MNTATANTQEKRITWRLVISVLIFFAALALFGFIADEIVLEEEQRFDRNAFALVDTLRSPGMTRVMTFITFFGSHYFLLPAYLLLIGWFLFFRRNRTLTVDLVATGTLGTCIMFGLKSFFHRQRPPDPLVQNVMGFSFPSGHSFSAFTFYGLLVYILWKQVPPHRLRIPLTVLLMLFAASIAFSRVYLHVHYASDVVAGLALCIVWLSVSLRLMGWVDRLLRRKKLA